MISYKHKYYKYKEKYENTKKSGLIQIYIIRHGETEWNKLGLPQGSEADIPLNDNGKEQAKLTGEYLKRYRQSDGLFDCIYSSPMKRTKETAEIIKNIIDPDLEVKYNNKLVERSQGKMSGLKRDDPLTLTGNIARYTVEERGRRIIYKVNVNTQTVRCKG